MGAYRRIGVLLVIATLLGLSSAAPAAVTVKGTFLSTAPDGAFFRLKTQSGVLPISLASGAKILRGQVGRDLAPAPLADLAPGDHIVAVITQDERASSIKAFYGRIQGTAKRVETGKLVLQDGRSVPLAPEVQVVMPDGRLAKPAEIAPGSLVVCRINPISSFAWTVVSNTPTKPAPAVAKTPPTAKPVITSAKYDLPDPAKPGDRLAVVAAGTPGGTATFSVKGLVAATPMKESPAGVYKASVTLAAGKTATGAPLVVRLKKDKAEASPVQASRLLTVKVPGSAQPVTATAGVASATTTPAQAALPKLDTPVTAESSPPAQKSQPVVKAPAASATEPSATPITILDPEDGARLLRAIRIRGKARPDSRVQVTVTYNNGRTGLLRLAGQVASQLVAVGNNGEFAMGPIALEGPLATRDLRFTIKAYYPDAANSAAVRVVVVGERQ